MSPEANNPQGPRETQNLDTTIHPEGVRPFNADKGDLVDVAPHLEVPADPSVIDPVTRNVEFDKVEVTPVPTAPETEKPAGWKKWVAGLVGGAVLAGGGVMAGKALGGEPTEPRSEPSVSASPEPGSAPGEGEAPDNTTGGENPNETEGTPETPTGGEVVAPVDKYPTAIDAIVPLVAQIEAYQNYYGTTKNLTSNPLSEEQKAEHEMMLESVFGPHYADDTLSGFVTNLKESWTEIVGYKSLTQQSIDAGYDDEELFTLKTTVSNPTQVGPNIVKFTALHDANFENNEIEENMAPEYAASIEKPLEVTAILEQADGAWYISDWQTS